MGDTHLRKIAEFFESAIGEERGQTRKEIEEFLKGLYQLDCDCNSCLFKEFQKDLKTLRLYGSYIYSSKNVYELITQDRKGKLLPPDKQYKKLMAKKPKRYFHLSKPEEFAEIISKLSSIANGMAHRATELSDKQDMILAGMDLKKKHKQLKAKLIGGDTEEIIEETEEKNED